MVRVRYRAVSELKSVSTQPVLCGTDWVTIELNDVELTYELLDTTSGDTVGKGQSSTKHDLRKKVKAHLLTLGAKFDAEVRDRTLADNTEVQDIPVTSVSS